MVRWMRHESGNRAILRASSASSRVSPPVQLRVSVTRSVGSTIVKVDGRLTVASLHDLEHLVGSVDAPAVIDLSNLVSADDAGVATLRSLAGRGARLVGVTPYVALLLADESGPPQPPKARSRRPRNRRADA
ncbi:MAG TPA: hypothetical protein VIG37_29740 [Methylomirabilota bacterium]|jgi:hypothetical protein